MVSYPPRIQSNLMSILIVILMYATWSSVFSLGKIALELSPPPISHSISNAPCGRDPPWLPPHHKAIIL